MEEKDEEIEFDQEPANDGIVSEYSEWRITNWSRDICTWYVDLCDRSWHRYFAINVLNRTRNHNFWAGNVNFSNHFYFLNPDFNLRTSIRAMSATSGFFVDDLEIGNTFSFYPSFSFSFSSPPPASSSTSSSEELLLLLSLAALLPAVEFLPLSPSLGS